MENTKESGQIAGGESAQYETLGDTPFDPEAAKRAQSEEVISQEHERIGALSERIKCLEGISSADIVVYEVLNATNSDEAKKEFMDNPSLDTPHFVYGQLDEQKIRNNINTIQTIAESIQNSDVLSDSDGRLLRVLLDDVRRKNEFVQACIDYQNASSQEEKERAASAQRQANIALYGEPDEATFYSILSSELGKIKVEQLSPEDKEMYQSLIDEIGEIKPVEQGRFIPKPETVQRFSEQIDILFENFWTHIPEDQESFTTKEACDIVNEILDEEFGQKGATEYHAEMSDTAKSVSVNHQTRTIIFPVNRSSGDFTRLGLKKIIAHELCTHAYRALVYEQHPIYAFSHELPGNEEIDEGIAKCCEQAVAGRYSDSGIEHYINIGLANFKGKSFREIFEIQQKLLFLQKCGPEESAEDREKRFHAKDNVIFSRTTRCFRGTGELPNNKDLVYYNGANRVWKFIEDNIDDPYLLDCLFLSGKTNIFDEDQRGLIYDSKTGKYNQL